MVKSDIYATLLRILNQNRFTLDVKKKKKEFDLCTSIYCPDLDEGKPWWLDMFSFGKYDTSNFGHKFKI